MRATNADSAIVWGKWKTINPPWPHSQAKVKQQQYDNEKTLEAGSWIFLYFSLERILKKCLAAYLSAQDSLEYFSC